MRVETEQTMRVRVRSVTWEADGINAYELCPLDVAELPVFTAGAHVDVLLPNGLVRSYSLTNPQGERTRYVIAVNKSPSSSGGSRYVHDQIRPGDIIQVRAPRNNFPLDETAPHSVLIAGGIGITPLWSMVQRLTDIGRSWELYYCARTRANAAFLAPLAALAQSGAGKVHLNFDQEPGGRMLDLAAVIASARNDAHLYCCGPAPMLKAFRAAAADLEPSRVHFEYFAADEPVMPSGGFTVVLARSGRSLLVPPGRTILEVLRDEGIEVPYSCQQGICGSCETKVIEGVPDHRDFVLSQQDQEANKTMMICCSGCKGDRLVLDL